MLGVKGKSGGKRGASSKSIEHWTGKGPHSGGTAGMRRTRRSNPCVMRRPGQAAARPRYAGRRSVRDARPRARPTATAPTHGIAIPYHPSLGHVRVVMQRNPFSLDNGAPNDLGGGPYTNCEAKEGAEILAGGEARKEQARDTALKLFVQHRIAVARLDVR